MSLVEIKKINSDMNTPLDTKLQSVHDSLFAKAQSVHDSLYNRAAASGQIIGIRAITLTSSNNTAYITGHGYVAIAPRDSNGSVTIDGVAIPQCIAGYMSANGTVLLPFSQSVALWAETTAASSTCLMAAVVFLYG